MQIPVRGISKAKFAIHCVQVPLLFVVWCCTVGVLVTAGEKSSPTKWYFAVAWLTIPALIYQTMVARFERTKRFANPFAYAAIDSIFCILWFSGFIAVAVWEASGIKRGAAEKKVENGSCDTFAFGSASRCKLSKASVGLGVVLSFMFGITTAMSIYGINYYRKNGHLPGDTSNFPDPMMMPMNKPNEPFSASMDDDEEDLHNSKPNGSRPLESETYRPVHGNDYDANGNGHANGNAEGWAAQQQHTPYGGHYEDAVYPAGGHQRPPQDDYFSSEPASESANGRVPFPRADYERA